MFNYGAQNSPYTDGWRNTGPPLWQEGAKLVCNRYSDGIKGWPMQGDDEWTKFRGGRGHYVWPFSPVSWP